MFHKIVGQKAHELQKQLLGTLRNAVRFNATFLNIKQIEQKRRIQKP